MIGVLIHVQSEDNFYASYIVSRVAPLALEMNVFEWGSITGILIYVHKEDDFNSN